MRGRLLAWKAKAGRTWIDLKCHKQISTTLPQLIGVCVLYTTTSITPFTNLSGRRAFRYRSHPESSEIRAVKDQKLHVHAWVGGRVVPLTTI